MVTWYYYSDPLVESIRNRVRNARTGTDSRFFCLSNAHYNYLHLGFPWKMKALRSELIKELVNV